MKPLQHLAAVAVALTAMTSSASAQVLLRDDFGGASLDEAKWTVGTWKLGRTQLGPKPTVAGGMARLKFETFDPRHAGQSFVGTELDSKQLFALGPGQGHGVEFEARVRVNRSAPGLVASIFTYKARDIGGQNLSDEIDFEFLSNEFLSKQPTSAPRAGPPIQLTTYREFNNTSPNYEDKSRISAQSVPVAGLNLARFNTFLIRWLPDRVEWLVNGRLIRTSVVAVPQREMHICLNFWAPEKSWGEAFSDSLQPAKTAAANRVSFYDVDYVEVRRVSTP